MLEEIKAIILFFGIVDTLLLFSIMSIAVDIQYYVKHKKGTS